MYKEACWEYFQIKCSFQKQDLFKHYKETCKRYHLLNGIDDPSMKHAFITSFPEERLVETFKLLKLKNKPVAITPFSKIFQHIIEIVEKLCTQHKYFKKLMKGTVTVKQGCKKPDLSIKCVDKKRCTCPTKKKKDFQRYKFLTRYSKRKTKMSYLRKKKFQGFNKSNRYYIHHKKKGHYVKKLPKQDLSS